MTNDGWILACLAVMAVALVAMAAGQVVLAMTAARLARQASDTIQQFQRDVRPVIERVHKITEDAAKTTALAAVQVERIDQMIATTAKRVDETLAIVQDAVTGPLKQGAAVIAGFRAALEVFRSAGVRRAGAREDEDALFIG